MAGWRQCKKLINVCCDVGNKRRQSGDSVIIVLECVLRQCETARQAGDKVIKFRNVY